MASRTPIRVTIADVKWQGNPREMKFCGFNATKHEAGYLSFC
jgi:hypothetical protein